MVRDVIRAEIRAKVPLAAGISQIVLAPASPLPFSPGQYVEVLLDDERRPYSLCEPPSTDGGLAICIHHDESDFARRLVETSVGDAVAIGRPRGAFYPLARAGKQLLFIATGTGIAPFHSMRDELEARLRAGAEATLLLGARTRRELLYDARWRRLAVRHERFRYLPTLSRAADGDRWEGRRGRVDAVLGAALAELAPAELDAYLCGHEEMVYDLSTMLVTAGVEQRRIHTQQY